MTSFLVGDYEGARRSHLQPGLECGRLLPAHPDMAYWHEHVACPATVYFLRGRMRFGPERGAGSVLIGAHDLGCFARGGKSN